MECPNIVYYKISIHASAKEATQPIEHMCNIKMYFNPRLREGGDFMKHDEPFALSISIHASAKEATPETAKRA